MVHQGPLVSVIIPAYNREHTIQRAVNSVLAQTYRPVEIIVVDDGSTDATADQLQEYGDRVRLVRQKNGGPSSARNAGIRQANGEIISFLDSDDAWLPEKLACQVALLEQLRPHGVLCCICNARMVNADGTERTSFAAAGLLPHEPSGIWANPAEVLLTRFILSNQTLAVRRELLERTGFFNEKFRLLEDYDLALRLALMGPWAYVAEPLVVWHGGAANSLSATASDVGALQRTMEIIAGLQTVEPWASRLPRSVARRHLSYLRTQLRLSGLARQRSGLVDAVVRLCSRAHKWVYYRLPGSPQMIVQRG